MSVASALIDAPLGDDSTSYRHNRSDPLAAMSRRLPLWFAATCLVGAMCQPDVQATVRQAAQQAAALTLEAVEDFDDEPPVEAVRRPVPGKVAVRPAEPDAIVDRIVSAMASGKPAASLEAAGRKSGLTGRQGVAPYVAPAQQALVRHITKTWRVPDAEIQSYVARAWKASADLEIDPFLILAVMATESSFNHRAQSSKGAQGLMQVHTRVHQEKFRPHGGPARAFDPETSIRVGSQILKQYLDRYGSARGALKAYVGAARLRSDGGYASKVLRRHAEFQQVVRTELTRLTAAGADKAGGRPGSPGAANGAANGAATGAATGAAEATRVAASSINASSMTR